MSFDLNKFLENNKPKSVEKWLGPYMRTDKLDNYMYMKKKKDIARLLPLKTYIKYIRIEDSCGNKKRKKSHIKCGGILISGGTFCNKKYVVLDDPKEWTHLTLKYDPSVTVDPDGKVISDRVVPYVYKIKLSKVHVFYKIFGIDVKNMVVDLIE